MRLRNLGTRPLEPGELTLASIPDGGELHLYSALTRLPAGAVVEIPIMSEIYDLSSPDAAPCSERFAVRVSVPPGQTELRVD